MNETPNSAVIEARLFFLHALSPIHVGAGEGLGAVNLPTARESATQYPYVPGSSIKGILRDLAIAKRGEGSSDVQIAFGPKPDSDYEARGGLAFSDGRLLALPVRSLFGGFAWATSETCLRRLVRDAREAGIAEVPGAATVLAQLGTKGTQAIHGEHTCLADGGALRLGDLPFLTVISASAIDLLSKWIAESIFQGSDPTSADYFGARLVAIGDTDFSFLVRTGLEVRHRVKIDRSTGTAAGSGPWTEEYLPTETLLAGIAIGRSTAERRDPNHDAQTIDAKRSLEVLDGLVTGGSALRFGGKSSVGMGRARLLLRDSAAAARK